MSNKANSKPIKRDGADKPIILALDSTTLECSVSIARGHEIVVTVSSDKSKAHSASLLEWIKDAIDKANISIPEVDLYAVASGPGSFTGMRVGISTVKALSASTETPCIGISTLKALAHCAGPSNFTCAVISAGRNEVFSQTFSVDNEGNVCEINKPSSCGFPELLEHMLLFESVLWVGSGATKHLDEIDSFVKERGIGILRTHRSGEGERKLLQKAWAIDERIKCVSESVAYLAYKAFLDNQIISPEQLSAEYVRATEFEVKITE